MSSPGWPAGTTAKTVRSVKAILGHRFGLDELASYSPAQMGMELLRSVLGEIPPQTLAYRRSIIANTPQHRIEWLMPDEPTLPALYHYDGRAMYLGCAQCSDGGRPVEYDGQGSVRPYDRGRYRVRFAVPNDYDGPGILPVQRDDRPGWDWPRDGEGISWCSCAQARLAAAQGWRVEVIDARLLSNERWLSPWAGRLETSYVQAFQEGAEDLARAIRSVCLHTIGSMHRTGVASKAVRVRPEDLADIGPGEEMTLDKEGHLAVKADVLRGGWWKPWMSHPEWSAAVWATAQYRVTRAMMSLPRRSVVAVYGDSVYTTEPMPAARPEQVGWLRLKKMVEGPMQTPRNWAELWAVTK